ncbi:peptide-methionine (S)-S-oxide reductase MsrA [Planctomicrobium sp. SH664]|uniref:peptide-methionine (S)-S-oxide reductase MsrA n=1 Tax=Planctomicrobium sp. SH664 TaxID=3448125 RepID=UPI003F5C4C67
MRWFSVIALAAVSTMILSFEGENAMAAEPTKETAKATFGGGCFWCTEAVFRELKGVDKVVSGYSGGVVKNPTYRQVCTGQTGHAEVIQITYHPEVVPFEKLLEVFFATHDPTTLNRQGHDEGTQYRSVVFYENEQQKKTTDEIIRKLNAAGAFANPIVTEVSPLQEFYPAEDYHQDYFALNGSQPYCQAVIRPKLDKFRKVFHDQLKTESPSPAKSR